MIAEAFENAWIENVTGICPVEEGTLVDVEYRDGVVKTNCSALLEQQGRDTQLAFWQLDGKENDIIAWRLHKPEKTLEEAYDVFPDAEAWELPSVSRIPPTPSYKPSKQEGSDILTAFNRMTGRDLTEDELNTLKILLDVFGEI